MGRKAWVYTHTSRQRVGTMKCNHCKALIRSGPYRYYGGNDGYRSQCLKCSRSDDNSEWSTILSEKQVVLEELGLRVTAFIDFQKKHGYRSYDFEEKIQNMQDSLQILAAEVEELTLPAPYPPSHLPVIV